MMLLSPYRCLFPALFLSLLLPPTPSATCPCNTTSNYALLMDFYTTTTGWITSDGWGDLSVPLCSWWGTNLNGYGITCDGTDIAGISLETNGITGSLPVSWSSMTQLQQLYLNSNSLTGTLPPSWANMTQLQQLYLYGNSLTGTLPPSWSNMAQMNGLALLGNSLTGTLLPSWSSMTQLQMLYLYGNSLTGTLPRRGRT